MASPPISNIQAKSRQEVISQIISNFHQLPQSCIKQACGSDKLNAVKKDVFILKCRGYNDMLAYLAAGLELPTALYVFDLWFPKDDCKKLSEIDKGIYEMTRQIVVGVGSSCNEFTRYGGLQWLRLFANQLVLTCQNAKTLLSYGEFCLPTALDILLQDKYQDPQNRDIRFKEAADHAKGALKGLQSGCEFREAELKKLIKMGEEFQQKTKVNANNVKFLIQWYRTGPVVDSLTRESRPDHQPYAVWVHAELERLRVQLTENLAARDEAYQNYVHDSLVADSQNITYIYSPITGAVVHGIYADRAKRDKDQYDSLEKKVEQDQQDIKILDKLLTHLNGLIIQMEKVDMKLGAAMDSLNGLALNLHDQNVNFANAIGAFQLDRDMIIDDSLFALKPVLMDSLKKAAEMFGKIAEATH